VLNQRTATDLAYNIMEELLVGSVDGTSISAHVVSGGRAGSKTAGAVNPFLANNPYATGVKQAGRAPGGPLILGRYRLKTHESKPSWIRLLPFDESAMHGRSGFAIHGRGPRGSDGCIVPQTLPSFSCCTRSSRRAKAREARHPRWLWWPSAILICSKNV
jgi:hypothetical protein